MTILTVKPFSCSQQRHGANGLSTSAASVEATPSSYRIPVPSLQDTTHLQGGLRGAEVEHVLHQHDDLQAVERAIRS